MGELQCEGVAVWGSCSVGELWCGPYAISSNIFLLQTNPAPLSKVEVGLDKVPCKK